MVRHPQQMGPASAAIATAEAGHGKFDSGPGSQGLDDGAFAPLRDRHGGDDAPDFGQAVDMPVTGLARARVPRHAGADARALPA